MLPHMYFVLLVFIITLMSVKTRFIDIYSNHLQPQTFVSRPRWADQYLLQEVLHQIYQPEKVRIDLYYESLCPDCRSFDTQQFIPAVKKLMNFLDIHVYPYGNAQTYIYNNGSIVIKCQHGPPECYGNMLHACAIDKISNYTTALVYNSCMMDYFQNNLGSDDEAADKCGRLMNIDSIPIKTCAKSERGLMLLKSYGEKSKEAHFRFVPYVLINGAEYKGNNFMRDICAAFKNPPNECNESRVK